MESGFWLEDKAFLDDPDEALGFDRYDVFRQILDKTPLDIYGIDFGVSSGGEVVVFEINASMPLISRTVVRDYPYLQPYRDKLFGRIEDFILTRALEARSAKAATPV